MGWSDQFLSDIEQVPSDPIFLVHFIAADGRTTTAIPGTDDLVLSSSPEYGDVYGMGMSLSVGGQRLRPSDWSYTAATASVVFVSDSPNAITKVVRKGQVTQIKMGFPGYARDDFQTIFFGRLSSISGNGPNWRIEFDDATTLLQMRWTGSTTKNLFSTAGQTTTLTVKYHVLDSTLTVADNSKLQITGGSSPVGIVKVTPNSGDDFFIKFTGKGSGTLTGVPTSASHDTTAADANIGNTVTNVAFLSGSAVKIYQRLLISDGTTAGDPNVYPEEWGFGIPEEYVDIDDIDAQASVLFTSGTTCSPEWKVQEEQNTPWQWLFNQYVPLGMCPVVRQGQFTMRSLQNPNQATITSGLTITDADVIDFVWYAYHPDIQSQYLSVRATTTNGLSDTVVLVPITFPVDEQKLYDLSDTTWAHSSSGQENIRDNILGRVAQWSVMVPYALRVDLAGLKFAQLCPGDIVSINLEQLDASNGYDEYYLGTTALSEVNGWTERQAMVTGVDADYIAGMVTLELSVIPEFE
jgi:hypothetical protein